MLNNLATELIAIGIPTEQDVAWTDTSFAILLDLWKLAQYENDPHPLWRQAAWALWSTGELQTVDTHDANVPLYLLILSETPYQSPAQQQQMIKLGEIARGRFRY